MTHYAANPKEHTFEINLGNSTMVIVKTLKDIVNVNIIPGGLEAFGWFESSTGMMGSFRGGTMLARDGITVMEDPDEFGQEWRVLDR